MRFRPARSARRGFTLVEALVATTILAVAGSALLFGLTAAMDTTQDVVHRTIAAGLAQQLMDEVAGLPYADKTGGPYESPLVSAVDATTGCRTACHDQADFHGTATSPPVDSWGVRLGDDDGAGGQRHANFRAPADYLARWKQSVSVRYANPADLKQDLPDGQTSDYRSVAVVIGLTERSGQVRELARLRRVFAYVPPLP